MNANDDIQYFDGNRNATYLLHQNYLYTKSNGDYWKCRHRDCDRILKLVDGQAVLPFGMDPIHPMHFKVS